MPATVNTEIAGAREAIRALNKIEPGLRKQFAEDATRIAQPAIDEAKRRYNAIGWGQTKVRGVSRAWAGPAVNGRRVMPFNTIKAQNGVKVRVQSDMRRTALILLEQRDAGAAILESAGRRNPNPLGEALGFLRPSTSRILGPSVFSKREQISDAMNKAMLEVVNRVDRELN